MTKFVFLAHGEMDPSPQSQDAHRAWWASMSGHVIDSGNPLVGGLDVTREGEVEPVSEAPVLGYCLVEAESRDAAVALLATCPMDMWVYEAVPM